MLRGHFGSVELIRSIINPCFRRNLSAASVRYAKDKDGKKADGVFSWLKYIFKSDDGIQETRNVTIGRGPVSVLDYPETHQPCLINFKLDYMGDQGSIEDPTNYHQTLSNYDLEQYRKNNRITYEHQRLPAHDLLALSERIDAPIRTIMGCTPRNTKPPIREPNMPEKQEKKDEKKEKKKKKPVIRMEGGPNEPGDTLHDNLDVNFRHQWGVRLPEEVQDTKNTQSVGSIFHDPIKNLQLTMSSSKDSDQPQGQIEAVALNDPKQEAKGSETSNVSPSAMAESNVVDEDYNVPPGMSFDEEVSAWKQLVLRSKVPPDLSNEDIPKDGRRADLLSIRPEPPQPKLDVQAVPTSNDQTMNEEEDDEFPSDVRTNLKMDTGRASSSADVHKLDNKKLHTGSVRFPRKSVEFLRRTPGLHGSARVLEAVVSQRAFDFSTSTDSGWGGIDQTTTKETEQAEPGSRNDQRSSNMEVAENFPDNQVANVDNQQERLANFDQPKQTESEQDFTDGLNRIADREIEISLNKSRDEDRDTGDDRRVAFDRQDRPNVQDDGHLRSRTDDFHASFDYANAPYDDDYYPGYESMSLEPVAERSITEKSKESQQEMVTSNNLQNEEGFATSGEEMEYREEEYVSDGNYIRLPGDPYPYSREHFNKWHVYDEDHETESQDVKAAENPHDEESASIETMQTADGVDDPKESKKSIKAENDSTTHVETIQPDIHLSGHGVNTNASQRYTKDNSSLIQKPKDASLDDDQKPKDIYALRNEQLSLVSRNDIEKIYESKNYAYLRAEEMKNFQLNLKSKSRANQQDTSV